MGKFPIYSLKMNSAKITRGVIMWRDRKNHKPIDDKNYLVSWLNPQGEYSTPHRAYYLEDEDEFFSLENNNSHPIVVDIFLEIPQFLLK